MTSEERQAAQAVLQQINAVEGFDPTPLALEYIDMNSSETRLRLPVVAQIAWFRLKHPEGRIAVSVAPAKDCFVATARIYLHYSDPAEHYISEATASRGYLPDKPTVSPREWAQTAAIGIALRNAGFGLQFGAAGDAFDSPAVDELGGIIWSDNGSAEQPNLGSTPQDTSPAQEQPASSTPAAAPSPPPPSTETPLEQALNMPCPIKKHQGKTLGDVLREDPKAIVWVATKFTRDPKIAAAAQLICNQSLEVTA